MRILAKSDDSFEIQMTSLIDMMFLLIIFFIVSTSFRDPERDLAVKLPQAAAGTPAAKTGEDIIINVRQGGVIVLHDRVLSFEQLERQLRDAATAKPKVIIRGDALTYHRHVVKVLDLCKRSGIRDVNIATKVEE